MSQKAILWKGLIAIGTIVPLIQSIAIAAHPPKIDVNISSTHIAQTDSTKPDKYLALAVQNYRQGNYPDALVDLNRAIKLKPDYAIAYDFRGLIKYQKLKDFAGALADFDRAVGIDPNFVTSYYNRALLKYRNLNDKPGGIVDMQAAAKLFAQKGDRESADDATDFLKKWGVKN